MAKRWIIRSLFMVPIVLCLMGWGWSGWYLGAIGYHRSHRGIGLGTVHGAILLVGGWYPSLGGGYGAEVGRMPSVGFWPDSRADDICFLGFRLQHDSYGVSGGAAGALYYLVIPYWFPLLVSSLLLLGAWRKTRSRPDPATAFPVVLKDAAEVKRVQS